MEKQLILNSEQCNQKIKRIAFEMFERNVVETNLVLAGVYDKGYILAEHLQRELRKITSISTTLLKISLDKFSPTQSEIMLDRPISDLQHQTIILIDDVLNSGRTLAYSIKPFLSIPVKKIEVAVLVDRGHKSFPIAADYIGYALSTTLKEHIEVAISKENVAVYLQ